MERRPAEKVGLFAQGKRKEKKKDVLLFFFEIKRMCYLTTHLNQFQINVLVPNMRIYMDLEYECVSTYKIYTPLIMEYVTID